MSRMPDLPRHATPERLTAVLRRAGVLDAGTANHLECVMSAVHDLGCLDLLD